MRFWLGGIVVLALTTAGLADPLALSGSLSVQDPSTIIKCEGRYYVFGSGQGILSKSSSELTSWSDGPPVFTDLPSWPTTVSPGFNGLFRAPDVTFHSGRYWLYYSVWSPGSKVAAIGLATNPTLNPFNPEYRWTDQGMVIQSGNATDYSAIDPSILIDRSGRHWLAFGSYRVNLVELNLSTGKRISPDSPIFSLASHESIEGSSLVQHGGFYYLFVNWGTCCSGGNSSYNIRVGRSSSVSGPYFDANGTKMLDGGGTLYLTSEGRRTSPGQLAFLTEDGNQWISYHYYDTDANGTAKLAIEEMAWVADGWPAWKLGYQDTTKPLEERVWDLLSRMTLDEKVSQMVNDSPAIERLGIPAYNWWSEGLHGVAFAGIATVFPQAIGLGATFNTRLVGEIASVISDEARVKYHDSISRGERQIYRGLTFWSPNINIFRDPRWGRGQETYGEDPYLTSRLGVAFVRGLQGDDPRYLKLVATPKHYAVHSGPEPLRHSFDAAVGEQDLRQTYLPAFEACVREGGAFSIMTAYNRTNGEACSAHSQLLQKILRNEWAFDGYVVSDCGAIADIFYGHRLVDSLESASAVSVKRGCDLNCGDTYLNLVTAVGKGLISESEINRSLARLLEARFRLGMFDPDSRVPYAQIPVTVNDSPAHRALALAAARESIVLLKNENATLPLSKQLQTIAVIGPNADSMEALLGNYNGWPSSAVTPLQGIRAKLPGVQVLHASGSQLTEALEPVPSTVLFTSSRPGAPAGLTGSYFANRYLSGLPSLTRVDSQINFHWWDSPAPGFPADNFSVRWTGKLRVSNSGVYQLGVRGDDGYRLYIDGTLIAEDWTEHAATTRFKEMHLVAGQYYDVRLDYYEAYMNATVELLWKPPAEALRAEAVHAASQSDVVIMVMGISPRVEGEEMPVQIPGFNGGDRTDITLPETQETLLKAVQATGKPVVLVLLGGSAISVNWASDNIPAILQGWYPGEEGGTAIADVLFGDFNPGGRLPVTVYQSLGQLPPFEEYSMAGRTYRYFRGSPLYPFGFGLSYTRFSYSGLTLNRAVVSRGQNLEVSVVVRNDGLLEGDEVVQLYITDERASVPVPIRSLQAFQRVRLTAGESRAVTFTLTPRQLSIIDNQGREVVENGTFLLSVGGKQPGFYGKADASTTQVLTARFRVGERRSR